MRINWARIYFSLEKHGDLSLPNRSAWLRRVITEAAQRELMKDGES